MKEQYCNRCKREIDWEEQEMLKRLPRESLLMIINSLREDVNQLKKLKGGNIK
jgi:hypothetical protein